jgi:hypothetical protein
MNTEVVKGINMDKKWEVPTLTEFDINERTRLEENPGDDGPDPRLLGGGDGGES